MTATKKKLTTNKKSSKKSVKIAPARNINAYGIGMFTLLSFTFLIIIVAKYL